MHDPTHAPTAGTVLALMPDRVSATYAAYKMARNMDPKTSEALAAENHRRSATKTHRRGSPRSQGRVAVIPVFGFLAPRMSPLRAIFGGTSTVEVGQRIEAAVADKSVDAIVLDIDSPGGAWAGAIELWEKIYSHRGTKPIIAHVNSLAGSAAYGIACACDEIAITRSGDCGSVGVVAVHNDYSAANEKAGVKLSYIVYGENKAEANPDSPLSDDALSHLQSQVNNAGQLFEQAVARYRSVPVSTVHATYGQGRCFNAVEAVRRGMADRIGTFESEIERQATMKDRARGRRKVEHYRRKLELISKI